METIGAIIFSLVSLIPVLLTVGFLLHSIITKSWFKSYQWLVAYLVLQIVLPSLIARVYSERVWLCFAVFVQYLAFYTTYKYFLGIEERDKAIDEEKMAGIRKEIGHLR